MSDTSVHTISHPTVHCVAGTRPELIKLAPVVQALREKGITVFCIHTGQHTDLARQAFSDTGLLPDVCLLPDRNDNRVCSLFSALTEALLHEFDRNPPRLVMVHGDTASAWSAAMAAFYRRIPVAHIEAGLRCPTLDDPFPEEAHRRLISRVARWHFAPTQRAAANLRRESVQGDILVTGNTAIDSIRLLSQRWLTQAHTLSPEMSAAWQGSTLHDTGRHRTFRLLVTVHRRENWGPSLNAFIMEVARWMSFNQHHQVLWLLHANPALQTTVRNAFDRHLPPACRQQLHLLPAQSYPDTVWALQHCDALATDSGGLQEEASAFFKPVLILRNSTERPEAIEAGYAHLTGCGTGRLIASLEAIQNGLWPRRLKADDPRRWPFGDGHAADHIAQHLLAALRKQATFQHSHSDPLT